jgi:hypothetical protein
MSNISEYILEVTFISLLIILLEVWSVAVAKYVSVHQKYAFIQSRADTVKYSCIARLIYMA